MARFPEQREPEAAVHLQPGDGAAEFGLVAGLVGGCGGGPLGAPGRPLQLQVCHMLQAGNVAQLFRKRLVYEGLYSRVKITM